MHEKPLQASGRSYVAMLKACTESRDLRRGIQIHTELTKNGLLKTNLYIGSALINMYAKCGLLSNAQDVFDKLRLRNVVTWNALIGGYAHHESDEKALECFENMLSEGVPPDAFTFSLLLKACGSIQDADKGSKLHVEIVRNGLLEKNLIVGTSLVDMYAKCGMLSKAQEVFDILRVRTVFTWTALIAGYTQYECCEEALNCFKQMRSEGVFPNGVTFACSLKSCGIIGAMNKGAEIHAELARNGLLKTDLCLGNMLIHMYAKNGMLAKAQEVFDMLPTRNIVTWTALMSGYVHHECSNEALDCFECLQHEGISPDAAIFSCILKACGSIGFIDRGSEIHAETARKGLYKTELSVGSALVDMYGKAGSLASAKEVFDILLVRNAFTWNALIAGYAQQGECESVLCCCEKMSKDRREPDSITFISILNACSHAGLVDQGQMYFETMSEAYGITPALEHHACIVDLLSRAGQIDRAIVIMQMMPLHPNKIMRHTFLGVCDKWDCVEYTFEEACVEESCIRAQEGKNSL